MSRAMRAGAAPAPPLDEVDVGGGGHPGAGEGHVRPCLGEHVGQGGGGGGGGRVCK